MILCGKESTDEIRGQVGARLAELLGTGFVSSVIEVEPQDDSLSTYAKMIFKQDGKIDFSREPEEVERLIRGFDPWPGAFCDYEDIVMKLWKAEPLKENTAEPAGTILSVSNDGIKIACGRGALLVSEIQGPGKKRVMVSDYLKGNRIKEGIVLK